MMKRFVTLLFFCFVSLCSAKELKIFLLTGQSNSLGAVKGSPASPDNLKKYEPNKVLYWHENFGQNEGVFPGASTSWEQVRPAMPKYGNLCMGPEYGFAYMSEKLNWIENDDLAIIKASRDGGDNSHWQKDGQAYKTLVQAVGHACSKVNKNDYSKISFIGLIYLQGESNGGDSVVKSPERFKELLKNLSSDLKPYGDTSALAAQSAIIGENANWSSKNETDPVTGNVTGGMEGRDTEVQGKTTRQLMRDMATKTAGMGYVPTRDLPKLTAGDTMGVHYSGDSQISIGSRFAYEAARLSGKEVGAVRSGFCEVSLSDADAWMNKKIPGKQVAVWNVASSVKPSRMGMAKLYGIVVEDPMVSTVVIQGTGSADNLLLGQGGIQLAPGKNLLIQGNVQLAGKQTWQIPGNSSVTIEASVSSSGKADHAKLSGQAEIKVVQKKAEAGQEARIILKDMQLSLAKVSWKLSGNVVLIVEGMSGKKINLGNLVLKDGATLRLNGAQLAGGSVSNMGGKIEK